MFFLKQKAAYWMRISDWSSDVCSSDLLDAKGRERALAAAQWTKLTAGQQAFQQDEEADSFFVLAVGRLKVSQLTSEGQEVIIRYIGPKEMFGCVAVCEPGRASCRERVCQDL